MHQERSRVLILDPDPVFVEEVRMMLSSCGCEIDAAARIGEAVERLKDASFGCVIIDEDLREIKGHDAVPVLKAVSPDTPVIVTAARNSMELEARIRRQDVFFYHVKTFDMEELRMAVENALTRSGKAHGIICHRR